MSDDSSIAVKKVKPYPILANCSDTGVNFEMKIFKLTKRGFLADVGQIFVRPLQVYDVKFLIPVKGQFIDCSVTVVKTYDNFKSAGEKKTRLVEFHFKNILQIQKDYIKSFIHEIGQQ